MPQKSTRQFSVKSRAFFRTRFNKSGPTLAVVINAPHFLSETEPKVGRVFSATSLRKEWMTACVAAGLGRKIEVAGKPYDPLMKG